METNTTNSNEEFKNTTTENIDVTPITKPYVMKNFEKELKRTKWPVQKKHNKNFGYIFIFIIVLTGFFALISLVATELMKLIGAN